MTVEINTTVECTWPTDDVTIIRKIKRDDHPEDIRWIGLCVNEIDQLIIDLQAAKAQAEKWEAEYRVAAAKPAMTCPICGGYILGDGYNVVYHCENADISNLCVEPDADPIYCEPLCMKCTRCTDECPTE